MRIPKASHPTELYVALGSTTSRTSESFGLSPGLRSVLHSMPTSLILANDQAAINGIRAAGANQLILAPGNQYTGECRLPPCLCFCPSSVPSPVCLSRRSRELSLGSRWPLLDTGQRSVERVALQAG